MDLLFRLGTNEDVNDLKELAIKSWGRFQSVLTGDNWQKLSIALTNNDTYLELISKSSSFLCVENPGKIIGMAFLVPSGNPTDIYHKDWSYIRFVTVDPDYSGQGIGKALTKMCIDEARKNKEHTIALHTSEFMDAARHIYESLGFKILQEIDQRLGKRYWLYKLDLV